MRNVLTVVGWVVLAGIANAAPGAKASLDVGAPAVTGSRDGTAVAAVMARCHAPLLACYKSWEDGDAALTNVTFTISSDGRVAEVRTQGSGSDVGACVSRVLATLTFAKPRDGRPSTVSFPLVFTPAAVAARTAAVRAGGSRQDQAPGVLRLTPTALRRMLGELTGDGTAGVDDAAAHPLLLGDRYTPGGDLGDGSRTMGTTGRGTVGHGGGTGYGLGRGRIGRHQLGPVVALGQPVVTGDLDNATVRGYIKRHISALQYCYEKLLLAKPAISGKVLAEFTIAADGTVSAAVATGVDPQLDACLATAIRSIEFPEPAHGGEVVVTYMFTFSEVAPAPSTASP